MLDTWYGALAVELKPESRPRTLLDRSAAAPLAQAIASELGRHLSGLDGLGLCWMAAGFDVAQLLRPGFPIYKELRQLYQAGVRDPLGEPQVMTLCARRGEAPSLLLTPDPTLLAESLLYLPIALIGAADAVDSARARLEACLLDEGLLDARSARSVIAALEAPIEHARLLSRDDLCAITAANLEHAGLLGVWQVLEVALFLPERNVDVRAGDGLGWSVIGGIAHLHLSLATLEAGYDTRDGSLAELLQRVRQALALLQAHAVPWQILPSRALHSTFIEQDAAGFWIEWLGSAGVPVQSATRVLSEQQLLWLDLHDAEGRCCAHAFPLDPAGYQALRQRLDADGLGLRFDSRTLATAT